MPKFGVQEKERIRQCLLEQGEVLFLAHGVRGVSIDDLIQAVQIARASFYKFYDSKEALYLDIAQTLQLKLFEELTLFLDMHAGMDGKELTRAVFLEMRRLLNAYPFLARIDEQTTQFIARKLPEEQLQRFVEQNIDVARTLQEHGVKFRCSLETASAAFQGLYHAWLGLQGRSPELLEETIGLLLKGMIHEIVEE